MYKNVCSQAYYNLLQLELTTYSLLVSLKSLTIEY